jgi:hypothetical protein
MHEVCRHMEQQQLILHKRLLVQHAAKVQNTAGLNLGRSVHILRNLLLAKGRTTMFLIGSSLMFVAKFPATGQYNATDTWHVIRFEFAGAPRRGFFCRLSCITIAALSADRLLYSKYVYSM